MSYDDLLKKEDVTLDDLLQDHRRKTKAPEGIIVGSPEYYKWWREQNVLRNRLYQKRHYLKKRKLMLALDVAKVKDEKTIEQAIAEVDDELERLKDVKKDHLEPARATPVEVKAEVEIPFIREQGDRFGVTYAQSKEVMNDPNYRGDESFVEYVANMNNRLDDILNTPKREE